MAKEKDENVEEVQESPEKEPKKAAAKEKTTAMTPWDHPLFAALCDAIAGSARVEILDEQAFREAMWESWVAQVKSHAYIEDKKSKGIVK